MGNGEVSMETSIRNCRFAYRCAKNWTHLATTENPDIRYCADCQREVVFCHTDAELTSSIVLNRCVAISLKERLNKNRRVLMGVPERNYDD